MKAILLAAGKGTRLKPITDTIPKCLVKINGRPLLDYWFDILEKAGVDDVLVNGYYMAEMTENHINSVRSKYPFKIRFVLENTLLGTGGTLKNNFSFVDHEKYFFFCHADNFTNLDLSGFMRFHEAKKTSLSIALFHAGNPKQAGIVENITEDGLIKVFTEKPEHPKTNLASAAMFLASPSVIKGIPDLKDGQIVDFSKEILPDYAGKMFGYEIKGFNIDIGTLETLREAEEYAKKQ